MTDSLENSSTVYIVSGKSFLNAEIDAKNEWRIWNVKINFLRVQAREK